MHLQCEQGSTEQHTLTPRGMASDGEARLGWRIHFQAGSLTWLSVGYWLPVPLHIGILMGKIGFLTARWVQRFYMAIQDSKGNLTREQGRICMVFPSQLAFPALFLLHFTCSGSSRDVCMFKGKNCSPISQWEQCHSYIVRRACGMEESVVPFLENSIWHTHKISYIRPLVRELPSGCRKKFRLCSWRDLPVPGN